MKATPKDIEFFRNKLAENPALIAALVSEFSDEQLAAKAEAKSWSAVEILAHVRGTIDVWTFSIYAMLAEDNPALPDINERKWARITQYATLPFSASFQTYASQRGELLRVLGFLPFEAWERPALILERKHTVFTQVRRMALHETEHVEQIRTLLGK